MQYSASSIFNPHFKRKMTVTFNQLIMNKDYSATTDNGLSIVGSASNGTITLSRSSALTSSSNNESVVPIFEAFVNTDYIKENHIYYLYNMANLSNYSFDSSYGFVLVNGVDSETFTTNVVFTCGSSVPSVHIIEPSGITFSGISFRAQLIDLTLLFGDDAEGYDGLELVSQYKVLYPDSNYAYNTGTTTTLTYDDGVSPVIDKLLLFQDQTASNQVTFANYYDAYQLRHIDDAVGYVKSDVGYQFTDADIVNTFQDQICRVQNALLNGGTSVYNPFIVTTADAGTPDDDECVWIQEV